VTRILLLLGVLLLSPLAVAKEAPAPTVAAKVLHFRLQVGAEPGKVIEGRLVEASAPGAGYDAALLDIDGDGTFETTQAFKERIHRRTKSPIRDSRIRIRHEDVIWTLELDSLRSPARSREQGAGTTRVHWSAQAGDLYVRFMDSPLTLHATANAARAARAFRMGPPLRIVIGTSSRGPNALVTVALMDVNGGELGAASRDKAEVRPDVKVLAADKVVVSGSPGYS
jgi:hypothetical protein